MHTKACLEKNPKFKELTRAARARVSAKIAILRREGKPLKQASAIAFKMERSHRLGPRGGYARNPRHKRLGDLVRRLSSKHVLLDNDHMMIWVALAAMEKLARALKLAGYKIIQTVPDKETNEAVLLVNVNLPMNHRNPRRKNPSFPVDWKFDKTKSFYRADLPDFRKTVIIVRKTNRHEDGWVWVWNVTQNYPNGQIITDGDHAFDSSEDAKADALRFYDETSDPSFGKNPIADKDVQMCLSTLAYLKMYPHMSENIPERILDALESEKLWNVNDGVTEKGEEFLEGSGAPPDEGEYEP